jgi:hypothetical protein
MKNKDTATHVVLASHRFGNIGHSFMSRGMEEAVRYTWEERVAIKHIEQHHFFDTYPQWHFLRLTHLIAHGKLQTIRKRLNHPKTSAFFWKQAINYKNCLGLIECGGPSLVNKVSQVPEMGLIFHHQLGSVSSQGVPALDLGLGSCFPLSKIPEKIINVEDRKYWRRIFELTKATSVRDPVAQKLIKEMGRESYLIPCAAFLIGYWYERERISHKLNSNDNYIIINYQKKGSNEDWGQNIDELMWRNEIINLHNSLARRHEVVFLCHNSVEYKLAKSLNLSSKIYLPMSDIEYGKIIAKSKAALVNRLHAAIPLASMGIPSIVIGNDTRLEAAKMLGLKTFWVKNVNSNLLETEIESLIMEAIKEKERLYYLRQETREKYKELLLTHCIKA